MQLTRPQWFIIALVILGTALEMRAAAQEVPMVPPASSAAPDARPLARATFALG